VPSPPMAADERRQERFEAMYQAYHGPVLGYVLRRTGNPEDAAGVVAETFLTSWRRLDEIPPGPEARLWLYGVARRVLANHHRGERRRSALAGRLRDDLAAAYRPPEYTGELAAIAEAFRRLPGEQRELLALEAWEGLDYGLSVLDNVADGLLYRGGRATERRRLARYDRPDVRRPQRRHGAAFVVMIMVNSNLGHDYPAAE
jgi:RNA polymerase sigma factor (sigma-70 family)